MNYLTAKQRSIVDAVAIAGRSVCMSGVAGSGKSDTILGMAMDLPSKRFLVITYARMLKEDTFERKVAELGMLNVDVFTFHSLCNHFYGGWQDHEIERVLRTNKRPVRTPVRYDVLATDEDQDKYPLLQRLQDKYLRDADIHPIIVAAGDPNQCIFKFNHSDPRLFSKAAELFSIGRPARNFLYFHMSESHRVTQPMANFVNGVFFGPGIEHMTSSRPGPPVTVLSCRPFEVAHFLCRTLCDGFRSKRFNPDDVFVLVRSVNSDHPYKALAQALTNLKIPIDVRSSHREKSGQNEMLEMQNKVIFTTMHQAKGRERKVVIVYDWDDYSFQTRPEEESFEPYYVAVTRAKEQLFVVRNVDLNDPPFVKVKTSELEEQIGAEHVTVKTLASSRASHAPAATRQTFHRKSVTDMTMFLPHDVLVELDKVLQGAFVEFGVAETDQTDSISVPTNVLGTDGTTFENVADLNGLAIAAMWEAQLDSQTRSYKGVSMYAHLPDAEKRRLDARQTDATEIERFLRLATVYWCCTSGLDFRTVQIDQYDWISEEILGRCMDNMIGIFFGSLNFQHLKSARFEVEIGNGEFIPISSSSLLLQLVGRLDILDDSCLWEIKCVKQITLDHKLQLVVYSYLWRKLRQSSMGPRTYRLFNVLSGAGLELAQGTEEVVDQVMQILFDEKYGPNSFNGSSDAEFMARMASLITADSNVSTATI
jgi:hypothetical protein